MPVDYGNVNMADAYAQLGPQPRRRTRNPFVDVGGDYGRSVATIDAWKEPGAFWRSQVGRQFIQDNPVAAYLTSLGDYDPLSARGRFLESQTQRVLEAYRQAQLQNPELWFREFLPTLQPALDRAYRMASPDQQGYNYARFAPPARTMVRPA